LAQRGALTLLAAMAAASWPHAATAQDAVLANSAELSNPAQPAGDSSAEDAASNDAVTSAGTADSSDSAAPVADAAAEVAPVDDETLGRALAAGPLDLSKPNGATPRLPLALDANKPVWSKSDNSDGSATYSVSRPLASPWAANVGADISVAPSPDPDGPLKALPGTAPSDAGAGSAYANVAVPEVATVEVRAEPANDHGRVATRLQRSFPLGKTLSLTMQGSVGVTEPVHTPGAPLPSITGATETQARILDTDRSVQLDVLSTGTSLVAGSTTFSGDPVVHNRVGATQKIYGPLSITGSLNDVGEATSSKSLSAGLTFNW
jgi:hypothetical protein